MSDQWLWCLHVIGPDDVHPAPDFATAQKWADWANARFSDPDMTIRFVVALWPWSAEAHAAGLERSVSDWTVPDRDVGKDFLQELRRVNGERAVEWLAGSPSDPLFWAIELGGEVGEILNVVKKLRREELGWRGSRATIGDLADEIADGVICLDSLARHYGIDLAEAVTSKFNKTSDKVGLPHKLATLSQQANEERG